MKKQNNKISTYEMIQKCKNAIYEGWFGNKNAAVEFYNDESNQEFFDNHKVWDGLVFISVLDKWIVFVVALCVVFFVWMVIWFIGDVWEAYSFLIKAISEEL